MCLAGGGSNVLSQPRGALITTALSDHPNSTAKMATRSLCRPVMRSAARRSPVQAYFSSSSIVRDAQKQQDQYTHFGFENVKAEEKEHKGMHESMKRIGAIANYRSRGCLLICRFFIRSHERPHVLRNPPPLEGSFRALPQPRF